MSSSLVKKAMLSSAVLSKIMLPVVTLIALFVSVAWFAGVFNEKVAPGVITTEKNTTERIELSDDKLYTVKTEKFTLYEPVSASVTAKQASIISSRLLARIDSINVRSGDNVKKGQLLIALEKSDIQAQVSQAKEQINAANARLLEANKNLIRAQDLHKKQLIADFDLDKAQTTVDTLLAELTTTKQALKQAQTTLSYTNLKAPIDGRVVDRFTEPGNTAQPGGKLLSIYNPLSLRVEGQVREQLALTLKQGQTIKVELPTLDKNVTATIEEIVPAANTGSRSFLIKASIDYQEQLLPGMYGRLLIPAGEESVLLVPINSIKNVGQLTMVWVHNNNGEVHKRFVRFGKKTSNELISVISGLNEGEKIALKF